MVDTTRETVHSKPPVSLGMYRSSYKRDYQWCEEYKAANEKDTQKLQIADSQLKAKEFAVPQGERVMTSSNSVVGERREVIPAPSITANSRADNVGESYLPKYHPATELTATRADKMERLQGLAEPENEMSYCQRPPAAAQTAGTAGMLLCPQKLVPAWATYQKFTMEMCQAMQHDALQNRSKILGSSVSMGESFDLDWRSTYSTDFQRWPGANGGYCKASQGSSHIFPEDVLLNQNWVSEYKDNYSIFLRRPNRSLQIPAAGLCSGLSFGKGMVMDTAQ